MSASDKMKTQPVGVTSIPSEYDNSSLFGKFFHVWIWRFFIKHRGQEIRSEDLHRCPKSSNSALIGEKLELAWSEHVKKCKAKGQKPFLLWPVLRLYGWFYLGCSILCWIGYSSLILQSVCMGNLIETVGEYKSLPVEESVLRKYRLKDVYLYGCGIVISQLICVLFINPFFFHAARIGMEIRVACCSLIYRKALRLSKTAFLKTSVGNVVNLLSNDTSRFDFFVLHTPFLVYAPISIFVAIAILWPYLNYVSIYGIAILLLYIPLQAVMGKQFGKFRAQAARLTDERVRLMNEYIPAMRVIKMYAWEFSFSEMINAVRKREISKVKKSAFLRAINISLFYVSAKVIIFVIFSIWAMLGNFLDAKTVFLTFALMNHGKVRMSATLFLPNAISFGGEGLISMKRITTFLNLPERQDSPNLNRNNFVVKGIDIELNIENLHASYVDIGSNTVVKNSGLTNGKLKSGNKGDGKKSVEFCDENGLAFDQDVLANINLNCKPTELCVLVGPVGCGKSSILMAVLGEMFINKGQIDVKGRISYSSQEAWTFAGTVKENILFNSVYDAEKYNEVVRVCALERDMTLFPQGDQTLIGDRGVSLSGGQKSRINLARALYSDADIYLLDDPLSAVDAHVAKHIFNEAIKGYLSKKVVILVTHQLQFIKSANKILLIKNGQQIAYGDYNSLLSSLNNKLDFSDFIGVNLDQNKQQVVNVRTVSMNSDSSLVNPTGSMLSLSSSMHLDEESTSENKKPTFESIEQNETNQTSDRVAKRESESLSGSCRAYAVYIKMGSSWWIGPLLLIVFFIAQLLFSGSDYWLSLWTDSEQRRKDQYLHKATSNVTNFVDQFTSKQNVQIYATLMFVLFCFSLFRGTIFFVLCMRASVRLHNRLFKNMVRAPMSFFEINPIGQILNRFSRDTGIIDDVLPLTAFDAFGIIATNFGIAILLFLVNYYTTIPIITLILLILSIRSFYIDLARKIKVLEGVNKSPVFTQLSTSLYGLTTIRSFRVEKKFENRFDVYANDHSSAWFFYIASSRWFLLYMDLCSIVFVGGVTFCMLFLIDSFNSATIGLMISSALMFAGSFQWGIRQFTELETQMTSVDRVNEYCSLPSEGDLESTPDKKPDPSWPEKGRIEFRNVTMRYFKDEKPVLNNLNFKVESSEKIGVVGRTGAGKSSIITALFRLTPYEGDIIIDGVNTKDIGLHDLRKKIAIIPQEPVLFTGTIRSNLDPFNEHEDYKLWKVLDEIQMHKKVEELNQGLHAPITDSGSNFSVGQKQLLCLARAVLRNNKILILDEATANCDPKTDELIQKTIRSVFDCTILTIAHRLNTVMDSSKILVMDAGVCVEYDAPIALINKKDSFFNQLLKATGREMARTLRKMAKEIELLRSTGTSRLELGEKIVETITVIKEDKDSALEDESDISEENLVELGELIEGDELGGETKKNRSESTHL